MFKDNPFDYIEDFEKIESELHEIGPTGYALVLHGHAWKTKFFYTTYPDEWIAIYDQNNLVTVDPVFLWALGNVGVTRWSEMGVRKTVAADYVMTRASDHGLSFGASAAAKSKHLNNKKCMLSLAREDRELTDEELCRLQEILEYIVEVHDGRMGLSDLDIHTIQALCWGNSQEEIARQMNTSREAIKKRIERIRKKLGARNATHVVSIALSHSLIDVK
ncbi:helix-turn-helix transcriptional regulator [Leisingera caerulea]|uniref:helix-turn-helix transcriptional regulator n=1 Tax=Leisingera caerulea TaxID=506591 RepID=UPI0003FA70BC|nr:autoinducer binding domain-containing protein [Leisingera caerulea]